jgi:hypothetical protein
MLGLIDQKQTDLHNYTFLIEENEVSRIEHQAAES